MSADERQAHEDGGRSVIAIGAGLIAFALGYALPIYARLPRPFYDPLARRWFIAGAAPPIPMGYWGQIAWATALALIVAATAKLLTRKPPSARAWPLVAAWTLTALAVVAGYFTWNNWP